MHTFSPGNGHGILTDASAASNADHGGNAEGVAFGDVDNDGDLDLYVGNANQPNVLLLNDGHGIFTDASAASNVDHSGNSHGVAFGDVDNDGGLDLYVGNANQPNVLLRNAHHGPDDGQHDAAAADWLVVLPLDGAGHRTLHGAAVRVLLAGTRVLVGLRTVDGGSGYCSQSAYGAHFGLPPVAGSGPTATYHYDVEVRPPGSEEWSVAAEGVAGGITLEWRSGRYI